MIYYIIALLMGVAIALQAPINSALGRSLQGSPLIAALISFTIGTILLAIIAYFNANLNINVFKALVHQSWWKFLGGILGAFFVFGTILLAPKIGLINMFLIILFGQLLMSVGLDHFGAFELNKRAISWEKILGLGIVFVGLLVFFSKELLKKA
ncbi:hypothetical protein DMB92_06415 [Campylobacter sp. MIT 99-7217]|uniref:DMT family transporter n=1 Tax=Campylobacter sp. MIT 99-7217 TaxID=535091 RepID=UPI0011598AB3|nr:DMT family transporter [Campylobacter sp. MIT 99-7217]TQR31319.1 hypothetical protein DMB92_06415 [Campylobacter sp. MIT 99-7217]